jgi:large subunit ribosomal protein L25
MDTTLSATSRTNDFGKGPARKLRAAGRLPAVLYSEGKEAAALHVDPAAIELIFRTTRNRNTVLTLDLDGQKIPCIVREAQRHPFTREIQHLDLYRLDENRPVEVDIPVEPFGKPAGLVLGGRLRVLRRTVKVRVPYTKIPEKIAVNVDGMNIGERVKVSQLPKLEAGEYVFKNDFNVVDVAGKAKK